MPCRASTPAQAPATQAHDSSRSDDGETFAQKLARITKEKAKQRMPFQLGTVCPK